VDGFLVISLITIDRMGWVTLMRTLFLEGNNTGTRLGISNPWNNCFFVYIHSLYIYPDNDGGVSSNSFIVTIALPKNKSQR